MKWFFINVRPNLANSIKKPNDGQIEGGWIGGSKVLQSLFLGEVSEIEIRSVVAKSKNKTVTDSDRIDISIVTKTTDCITKPLSYIFNLSFHTGIFPDRMKIAKVTPLFFTP